MGIAKKKSSKSKKSSNCYKNYSDACVIEKILSHQPFNVTSVTELEFLVKWKGSDETTHEKWNNNYTIRKNEEVVKYLYTNNLKKFIPKSIDTSIFEKKTNSKIKATLKAKPQSKTVIIGSKNGDDKKKKQSNAKSTSNNIVIKSNSKTPIKAIAKGTKKTDKAVKKTEVMKKVANSVTKIPLRISPRKKSPTKKFTIDSKTSVKGKGKSNSKSKVNEKSKEKKGKNVKGKEKKKIIPLPFRARSSWEGNSDSDGSVDSGVMDEDICFYCGKDTSDLLEEQWGNLIICDNCDGEYHLECVNLDRVPRINFTCTRCKKDSIEFEKLKYTVDLPEFELKKRITTPISYCYSPSKPLENAWEECKRKGMMIVSNVFTHEIMKKLTHGIIEKKTTAGRISDIWSGTGVEVAKRLSENCRNVIDRDGRFDIRLPEFVIQQLELEKVLEPITEKLRTIMGHPRPEIRTHNVVFVPVGSTPQKWHADDTTHKCKMQRYFTILIHLNPIDQECGGTEIWDTRIRRGDVIRGRPGDAFIFNGSLMHRGLGNSGNSHRFFYYASFCCKADANTDR